MELMERKERAEKGLAGLKERQELKGAAMGVGALVVLAGARLLRLPATLLTRFGIERHQIHRDLAARLDARTESVRLLMTASPE